MKIGVSSQNFRTITGHAGKARRFFVYAVEGDNNFAEIDRIDLPKTESMHEANPYAPHPLDALDVLITGGCGDGFVGKMARRGVQVVRTGMTDPLEAVAYFVRGEALPPPGAEADDHDHDHHHDEGGCGCSHRA
ncbi:MAG: nitrogen fixation protein [Hyphomicrobiales bacterium]|nr:MAG: nitrogen fixation protein [Hyphomicrobiales bacterium]